MTEVQPFSPGASVFGQTLHETAPDTWAEVFCPSGEYHEYRKRLLRRPVCAACGHRRRS